MPSTRPTARRKRKPAATLNVSIGVRYRKLTDDLVASGRYGSASEVIRAAMRLLEADEREIQEAVEGIRRGLDDVAAGRVRPFEEFQRDFEKRFRPRRPE